MFPYFLKYSNTTSDDRESQFIMALKVTFSGAAHITPFCCPLGIGFSFDAVDTHFSHALKNSELKPIVTKDLSIVLAVSGFSAFRTGTNNWCSIYTFGMD